MKNAMLDTWRRQTFSIGGEVLVMADYNKTPPYTKRLKFLFSNPSVKSAGSSAAGIRSIFVIAGSDAWYKARAIESKHAFLLLPPDKDPLAFDWSILAGHEPVHIIVEGAASTDQLFTLATAMDRDGIDRILYPNDDGSAIRYLSQRVIEHEQ